MTLLRACLGGVLLVFGLMLPMDSRAQSQSISSLIKLEENEQGERIVRFVWGTEPGVRYQLQESTDLESWTPLPGDPIEAVDLAVERLFEISDIAPQFLRVMALDEQPPVLRARLPEDGDFGVPRTGIVRAVLEDVSAIDPESIRVRVGKHGPFTVADEHITFDGREIRVSPGADILIGDYGEMVAVVLEAADVLGNGGTWTWHFELERPTQVADGLFVFGSEEAQNMGQRLSSEAAAVARQMGVVPRLTKSSHSDSWSLELVEEDRIEIRRSGQTFPDFVVGQLLANLAPRHVREIFYRRVTRIEEVEEGELLTLFTEEVGLPEVLEESAFQVGNDGILLKLDEEGYLVPVASQRGQRVDSGQKLLIDVDDSLRRIDREFSGMSWSLREGATVTLEDAFLEWQSGMVSAIETRESRLERFDARMEAELSVSVLAQWKNTGVSGGTGSMELANEGYWILTSIHGVPVWTAVTTSLTQRASLQLTAPGEVRTGFRQEGQFGVNGKYVRGGDPSVSWHRWYKLPMPERLPLTYTVNGSVNASVAWVPRVDIRVYGMAGVELKVDPRMNVSGSASWTGDEVRSAEWNLGAHADMYAVLSVVGIEDGELPGMQPVSLYNRTWWSGQTAAPEPEPIVIRRQPNSQEVWEGDGFQLSVEASGAGALRYQWYRNEEMLPGQTGPDLVVVTGAQPIQAGMYYVRVMSGASTLDSRVVKLTVFPSGQRPTPSGLALIPAGDFEMGDSFRDSPNSWGERPVHKVFVSAYYLGRTEVTKAEWDEVQAWAVNNGYTDLRLGGGKRANHPVHSVSWFDVVNWCNAASEREGLTPVYQTSTGDVFRTGDLNPTITPTINYSSNGYRLPSEAEWEKAARGGTMGQRFPWGDTISHVNANYSSHSSDRYDVSLMREFHPQYRTGEEPFTSPVGSFVPNGYGLFDMAGNVWEWCNDWWDASYYTNSPTSDPRGPTSGLYRVLRGGGWTGHARHCRSAYRDGIETGNWFGNNVGFRLARSLVP